MDEKSHTPSQSPRNFSLGVSPLFEPGLPQNRKSSLINRDITRHTTNKRVAFTNNIIHTENQQTEN